MAKKAMRGSSSRPVGITYALLAALALAPGPGFSAENTGSEGESANASPSGLQEVVVTANRRAERQQDVPISLTSFSQETLDVMSINSMDDISRVTPGITFQRNGTSTTSNYDDEDSDINIRGVQSTAGAATTGIYIDDTPIQSRRIAFSTQNAYPVVFDLERVEVLRGPQGTLFGASSEGGTVRFIQPQPSVTTSSGYVKTGFATTHNGDPTYEVGAAGGTPLIDGVLGLRVSASLRHEGGWVDRVNPDTLQVVDSGSNRRDMLSARAALTWKPADALSITPSLYVQQVRINDTGAYWPRISDPSASEFRNGNRGSVYAFDPFYIAALRLDWKMDWAELISSTAYYSRNQHVTSDYTELLNEIYFGSSFPPPGVYSPAYLTDEQRNFYEEIRLQSVNDASRIVWTTGLFYTHSRENAAEFIVDPTIDARSGFTICPQIPCPGGLLYNQPFNYVIDKQLAVFGEVVFKLTDTLKLTAGIRASHDIIDGASYVSGPFLGQAAIASSGSTSETPVTPRVVMAWQPDRDNLFYASASKGFRPGGVNSGVGSACQSGLVQLGLTDAPPGFKSDSLWSYEVGGKNTVWDHRLQINTSLFFIDWKDIQQSVYLGSCGLAYVGNLGQVHSRGGDIAVLAKATDAMTLNFTAAYIDAKYVATVCATPSVVCTGPAAAAAPIVSVGDQLAAAPWSLSASLDYEFPKFLNRAPYFHLIYTYSTAQTGLIPYQNPNNGVSDPTLTGIPVSKDLSLRAGLRWNGMDVSLFANNLLDQHPVLFDARDFAAPAVQLYFNRSVTPRTIGLTWTYHR